MRILTVPNCGVCPYHKKWSTVPASPMMGGKYQSGEYCALDKGVAVARKGFPKNCPLEAKR